MITIPLNNNKTFSPFSQSHRETVGLCLQSPPSSPRLRITGVDGHSHGLCVTVRVSQEFVCHRRWVSARSSVNGRQSRLREMTIRKPNFTKDELSPARSVRITIRFMFRFQRQSASPPPHFSDRVSRPAQPGGSHTRVLFPFHGGAGSLTPVCAHPHKEAAPLNSSGGPI